MPANPGVYNGGAPIRGLVSLPATTEMLTVDAAGNMSRQSIPIASFAALTGSPSDNAALASALAAKVNLAGDTMTGTLTAPEYRSPRAGSLSHVNPQNNIVLYGGFSGYGIGFDNNGELGTVVNSTLRSKLGQHLSLGSAGQVRFNSAADTSGSWDTLILRNATGPTLETRSAGGLRVRTADGSAAGALEALTYTSTKNDDSGVTPGFGWVDNAGAIGMAQWAGQNRLYFVTRGARRVMLNDTAMYLGNELAIGASMSNGSNGVYLAKDINDTTLAQRNGLNPQTFRVYNTYTSATNGEYLQQQWASNEARIGTAVGSAGGTQRNLVLGHWNSAGTWARRLTCLPDGSNLTLTSDIVTLESIGGGSFVRYGFGSWYASNNAIHLGSSGSRWGTLFSSAINTTGNVTLAEASNLILGTTTGTKIGTATTQRIGFFNATPVVQPSAVADATDAASVITQLNALLSRMRDLGLIAV